MTGKEKKISVRKILDPYTFDLIMDDVRLDGATYIVYEDEEQTKPSVVIMPYAAYELMVPNTKMME